MYLPLQSEYTFHNRYGTLVVETITAPMHVRDVHGKDLPDDCKFSLETAEQIALITENDHTQLAFESMTKDAKAYLSVHLSESTVVVVRVKSLEYTGKVEAREEIQMARTWAFVGVDGL